MALNVPTTGQWITFPTEPDDKATVSWKEERSNRSAVYYLAKAYWGYLDKGIEIPALMTKKDVEEASKNRKENGSKPVVAKKDKRLTVLGETNIFIAAEFAEKGYQGGPMQDYHILDLAGKEEGWITLRLNECFHYGQNGSGKLLRRWIVYHPPISPKLKAPKIFQHRFTGLSTVEFAMAASEDLPEWAGYFGDQYETGAELGGKLAMLGVNALKSVMGHFLHEFMDTAGVQDARSRYETRVANQTITALANKDLEKKDLKNKAVLAAAQKTKAALEELNRLNLTDEDKFLLALQLVESLKVQKQNVDSDADEKARMKKEELYLKTLRADRKEAQGWFSKFFGLKKKKESSETEKPDGNLEGLAKNALLRETLGDGDTAVRENIDLFANVLKLTTSSDLPILAAAKDTLSDHMTDKSEKEETSPASDGQKQTTEKSPALKESKQGEDMADYYQAAARDRNSSLAPAKGIIGNNSGGDKGETAPQKGMKGMIQQNLKDAQQNKLSGVSVRAPDRSQKQLAGGHE
ncbi:hypothetical protein BU16DRAFT_559369 [Lophium mytilinum]|uniref:Uncharacterized protein n=1 Tax=Lophium mytilinum TaxID=390894 RepID=A0A6A6R060_9PEZI|nr:hypothetical protein BU16DRAFT_559369 [Lophium mytilinum]